MIEQVTTKSRDIGDVDTLRIVSAFITSQIIYVIPYALLTITEMQKINTIILKS